MRLLVSAIDVDLLVGPDGNVYTVKQTNNYWKRIHEFPEDTIVTVIGVKKKIPEINDDFVLFTQAFPRVQIVTIPKPTVIYDYFRCLREIKRIVSVYMKNADGTLIRYQGHSVFLACRLARKYGVKQLVELGGDQWDAFWNHGFFGKILAIPMWLMCKNDIKHAEFVHYVTKKYLQERYPTDGKSIGLSNVELPQFDESILENRLVKIEQRPEKLIIGTAAAVNVPYKGQQYMIEALRLLKEQGITNLEYQIAGQGDNSFLKNLANEEGVSNQVKFVGAIPHDSIFNWLDSIDLYIQPSLQEGLPRAMVEAMSRGLPCIGAKTAGIPELIDEKYIYPHKEMPKKISECIIDILSGNEMKIQAKKNYEYSKNFELSIVKETRKKFYNDFISACERQ